MCLKVDLQCHEKIVQLFLVVRIQSSVAPEYVHVVRSSEKQTLSSNKILRAAVSVAVVSLSSAYAADARASTAAQDSANPWTVDFEVDQTDMTSNTVQRFNNPVTTRFDTVDYTGIHETLGRLDIARRMDWGAASIEAAIARSCAIAAFGWFPGYP